MSIQDELDNLCYAHIEKEEPISEEWLAWLIDTTADLNQRLSEAGLIVAALSVYGEQASLPALVRHARSQVHLIGYALNGRPVPEASFHESKGD